MAATVGELAVNLTARTGAFTRGMRNAERRTRTFSQRIATAARGMMTFRRAIAAVGLGVIVKRQLDAADAAGKLSDRIGIATERLMGLRYAAELTGAGAKTLDAGLETMAKRLGEAARGAGAARPVLEQLGLDIDKLIQLSPDRQFLRIADAISRLGTHTERAAAAANIFSKGNMALINTLAEGSAGVQRMMAEAERLGYAFDREMARKAERANDALTRLGATMKGLATTMAIELAPVIERLGNQLAEFLPGAAKVGGKGLLRGQNLVLRAVEFQAEWLRKTVGRGAPDVMREAWQALEEEARAQRLQNVRALQGLPSKGEERRQQREEQQRFREAVMEAQQDRARRMAEAQAAYRRDLDEQEQRWQRQQAERARQVQLAGMTALQTALSMTRGAGPAAQLRFPGAEGIDSLESYRMLARQGIQPTAGRERRTNEEILDVARRQLDEQRRLNQRIEELLPELIDQAETVDFR